MRRGEVWTASGGGYGGKPRPVLIIQSDRFDSTASVTVCPLTSHQSDAPLIRIPIEPSEGNALMSLSHIMIDKVLTLPRGKFGVRIGALAVDDMARVTRSLMVFLGIA